MTIEVPFERRVLGYHMRHFGAAFSHLPDAGPMDEMVFEDLHGAQTGFIYYHPDGTRRPEPATAADFGITA